MTDFQTTLTAVLAYAKEFKLSLDDIGKLDLIAEYRKEVEFRDTGKGGGSVLLSKMDLKLAKDTLGRSRETIIEQAQDRYRRESIAVEQAFYADKLLAIPEIAAMTEEQQKEIAAKICEVKKPDWKADWNSTSPILIDGETEARL
jgi:hypothetical protein